jgi:hypothetical protein
MARNAPKRSKRLQALIEEATVDCYTVEEEQVGFLTMIEDKVVCPFKARVIGEEVEVVELRSCETGVGVDAVCCYKGKDYRINISSLEWPRKKPEGYEWVEAYLTWLGKLG